MTPESAERLPQQERSRKTYERLLMATLKTLSRHGLDGTTIPRIAREAGVAPATVYRRFADKQALLRAACLHLLEMTNTGNREQLKERLGRGSLESAAREMVRLMFLQNRSQPKLMQAMETILGNDDDEAFVKQALALRDGTLDQLVQVMLLHRDEIKHPEPEYAVRMATLQTVTSIGVMCFKDRSPWGTLEPNSDEAISGELVRAYLAYLKS